MVEEMRPIWESFIEVDLGYSEEKAEQFAEGYEEELTTLPTVEKLMALERMHDECMTAGFEKAGIDEEEAMARYQDEEGT